MPTGIVGLSSASGGAAGLETLLARRLAEQKMMEEMRANQAGEQLRNKALDSETATRNLNIQLAHEDRQDNQANSRMGRYIQLGNVLPAGTPLQGDTIAGLKEANMGDLIKIDPKTGQSIWSGSAMTQDRNTDNQRMANSATDLEEYRNKVMDLRDKMANISQAAQQGHLDLESARLELARTQTQMTQIMDLIRAKQMNQDMSTHTPAGVFATAKAGAQGRAAGAPQNWLSRSLQEIFSPTGPSDNSNSTSPQLPGDEGIVIRRKPSGIGPAPVPSH